MRSDVVRQGRYAARFEVRPGDNNVAGSGTGERTHVYIGTATTDSVEGREQYWAWSTYIPPDFTAPMGGWNSFVGFHHTGTTGGGNIAFSVNDMSRIMFLARGGAFDNPIRKDYTLAPLTKGRWYDFVLHIKWSSDPSVGFVEVWLNGSRVVPKTITPTLYVGQGVYLKMGYYRAAYDQTTVIYHDGMRRGSTYEEVAAEFPSATPAPLPGFRRHFEHQGCGDSRRGDPMVGQPVGQNRLRRGVQRGWQDDRHRYDLPVRSVARHDDALERAAYLPCRCDRHRRREGIRICCGDRE